MKTAQRLALLAAAFCAAFFWTSGIAQAETKVPTQDIKPFTDAPGLKRFAGSVLLYRDDVAYDEIKLPVAKVVQKEGNEQASVTRSLNKSGQRTALQYISPPGRSALEVLRNYQQDLKADPDAFETVFECAGEAECGRANDLRQSHFAGTVMPESYWGAIGDNSPAACGGGTFIADFRYTVLESKSSGAAVAVMAWRPGDLSVYCDQPEFKKRTSIAVVKIVPKAREQAMQTITASELGKSLDANGKVAIYGILFDTAKADIKPESKASLDQIGALLKQQPALRLHVVGHTDNAGTLPANMELSRRRAEAVAVALTRDYAIAKDRLTANGVGSLAPVASNASDAGKAKNRRVELVLQ